MTISRFFKGEERGGGPGVDHLPFKYLRLLARINGLLGGAFKYFLFSALFGEDFHFD